MITQPLRILRGTGRHAQARFIKSGDVFVAKVYGHEGQPVDENAEQIVAAVNESAGPSYRKEYLGCLATCGQGRRGVITGYEQLPWGWAYVGVGLDGTQWSSRNPTDVAKALPPSQRPPAQPNGERT